MMKTCFSLTAVALVAGFTACKTSGDSKTSPDGIEKGSSVVASQPLVLYSGRSKSTVGPLLDNLRDAFANNGSAKLQIKYGKTAALAATLMEEVEAGGAGADVFFAQDAGALGLLAQRGLLEKLPNDLLSKVQPAFRSPDGVWVGISGRVRTVVYNTAKVKAATLPKSLAGFADQVWSGRVGWAPTNASFQAHVTALRVAQGDKATEKWLEAMRKNNTQVFPKNTPIVEAVSRGEIDVGLVNHYYLHKLQSKGVALNAKNLYLPGVDSMVNVAGVGILQGGKNPKAALELVRALLQTDAQRYFATQSFEYPLVTGIPTGKALQALSSLQLPNLDLTRLADLDGTLGLLRKTKVLQ